MKDYLKSNSQTFWNINTFSIQSAGYSIAYACPISTA